MLTTLFIIALLTSCSPKQEIDEKRITQHVRDNINSFIEMEPVLGADSFYAYEIDFYPENKLIAYFEDGHIGGYLLAEYNLQKGQIVILPIKEVPIERLDELMNEL